MEYLLISIDKWWNLAILSFYSLTKKREGRAGWWQQNGRQKWPAPAGAGGAERCTTPAPPETPSSPALRALFVLFLLLTAHSAHYARTRTHFREWRLCRLWLKSPWMGFIQPRDLPVHKVANWKLTPFTFTCSISGALPATVAWAPTSVRSNTSSWTSGRIARWPGWRRSACNKQSLPLGPHWGPWSSWGPLLWNGPHLVLIGALSPHLHFIQLVRHEHEECV